MTPCTRLPSLALRLVIWSGHQMNVLKSVKQEILLLLLYLKFCKIPSPTCTDPSGGSRDGISLQAETLVQRSLHLTFSVEQKKFTKKGKNMYLDFKIGLLLLGGSSQLSPAPFIQLHDNSYREYMCVYDCVSWPLAATVLQGCPVCTFILTLSLSFFSLTSVPPHCVGKLKHEV